MFRAHRLFLFGALAVLATLAPHASGFPDTPCTEIGAASCAQTTNQTENWASTCGLQIISVNENDIMWAQRLPVDVISQYPHMFRAPFHCLTRHFDLQALHSANLMPARIQN